MLCASFQDNDYLHTVCQSIDLFYINLIILWFIYQFPMLLTALGIWSRDMD